MLNTFKTIKPKPRKTRIFLYPTSKNLHTAGVALWNEFDEMLYDERDVVVNYKDRKLGDAVKNLFPKLKGRTVGVRLKEEEGIYSGRAGSASTRRTFPYI